MSNNFSSAKIVSIVPVGPQKVFDLEIKTNHNYVANGIVVHNCSYHDLLDHYGKKYNEEFYKIKDTFVTYKHRRILCYPSGPNKKTLRGRCLIGSTLINTEYGFIKLAELVQEPGQVQVNPTFLIDTQNGHKKVTHTYQETVQQTIKITTRNGFVIQGTPEHPIFVLKNGEYDWCRLDNVVAGQNIKSICNTQKPIWSTISELEDETLQQIVQNINAIGDYPIEIRTASADTNKKFIDMLFASHAVFSSSSLKLVLDYAVLQELQVILLHGFGLVTALENFVLTVDYFALNACGLLQNLPQTKRIIGLRNPNNLPDTELFHTETVKTVEIIEGECEVFDISVPEGNEFLANGMVSHNTRILSCLDEIGWFDNQNDGKIKMDATQVYVALDRSLLTVRAAARRLLTQGFDDIPNGYSLNVSSPSSARDKIIELVEQSKHSKKIFGFRRATWDMNPNITKEDLSEEFAKNPIDAERDYGCNPPLSDNAFISNFESIEGCFIGKPNKLRYKHSQKTMRDGTITRYAVVDEIAKSTKANIMAIDSGFSRNSFAAVCAHIHEGMPIISCAIEVMPNPGMPLNHALIFREALHPIIQERNVKLLLADRWQSIKLLQDAEIEFDDLIAHQYSLKYDDFWIIKQAMFDSEVVFPKLKRPIEEILKYDQAKYPYCFVDPIEHLALQCLTVRDMGNSIDKGDGLTDDVFRASCLALYGLQSEKYYEIFDNDQGEEERPSVAAIGYMAGRSSSSGQNSNDVHMSKSGQAIGVMFSKR